MQMNDLFPPIRFNAGLFLKFATCRFQWWYGKSSSPFRNFPGVGIERIPILSDKPREAICVDWNNSDRQVLEVYRAVNPRGLCGIENLMFGHRDPVIVVLDFRSE